MKTLIGWLVGLALATTVGFGAISGGEPATSAPTLTACGNPLICGGGGGFLQLPFVSVDVSTVIG